MKLMSKILKDDSFVSHLKNTKLNKKKYEELYKESIENNDDFWNKIGQRITWKKKYEKVKEVNYHDKVSIKWYLKGELNACYNCLDRHLPKRGDKIAIIWEGDNPSESKKITYKELYVEVCKFSNALKSLGIKKGEVVTIYMPMIPEAAIAMLACARIGAIHSVVFGGFASNELASRIDDSKAKILITASCGFEPGRTVEYRPLVDGALKLAKHKVDKVIFFQRKGHQVNLNAPLEISWDEVLVNAKDKDCVEMGSNEFAYILYTSGTTGVPKGIVRDIGGHIVALKWTMKNIYNIDEDDVWWSASDIGWIVGHSYIVYAPLFKGCTTVLF